MSTENARKVYNDMAKYFGLRARDAFLNPVKSSSEPKSGDGSSSPKPDPEASFYEGIFGNGKTVPSISDLSKMLDSADASLSDRICVTTMKGDNFAKVQNKDSVNKDQGWGGKDFKITDFLQTKDIPQGFDAMIAQVFPVATGIDVVDAEIASLFLNSLRTITMSRAVPYIDIRILSPEAMNEGNLASPAQMSLGRFLTNGGNDAGTALDPVNAKFLTDNPGDPSKNAPYNAVASMEVFTSPQTLVNRSKGTEYSREKGGPTDIFRPFMSIDSLKISDQLSGAGSISYKSGELTLKLFDKGRLSDIANFISPRRDPNIQFEITYGWSHPDGSTIGRPSDADVESRMGLLVDAMRVTERYGVSNTTFAVQTDGTVDITLSLFMASRGRLGSRDISQFSISGDDKVGGMSIADFNTQLKEIKKTISAAIQAKGTEISLPIFIQAPSAQSLMGLDADAIKKLKSFSATLKSKLGKGTPAGEAAAELYSIFAGKGTITQKKLLTNREAIATNFVLGLQTTPDPFLRANGGKAFGVTDKNLMANKIKKRDEPASSSKKQAYASYGKIVAAVVIPALFEENTEIQLCFSSFNQSAAGVYDYNVAQFPILLSDLKTQLVAELKRTPVMTVDMFIRFLNDRFLSFVGSKAYGLDLLYNQNSRTDKGQPSKTKALTKLYEDKNASNNLAREQLLRNNLDSIYQKGKRQAPVFVPPRVSMRTIASSTKAKDKKTPGKNVVRIFFQDAAAGRLMTTSNALLSLTKDGFVRDEDYSARGSVRNPLHNEVYKKNFEKLAEQKLIAAPPADIKDKIKKRLSGKMDSANLDKLLTKYDNIKVLNTDKLGSLRKFFFEEAPYLLYGGEGSGIVNASLDAEADDQLASMYLAQRISGQGDSKVPERPATLPFEAHPAQLSMTTFGCPFLSLMQKYFIDFATNTTLDNFYVISELTHELSAENFQTTMTLKVTDSYGKLANLANSLEDILYSMTLKEVKAENKKKKKKKK